MAVGEDLEKLNVNAGVQALGTANATIIENVGLQKQKISVYPGERFIDRKSIFTFWGVKDPLY